MMTHGDLEAVEKDDRLAWYERFEIQHESCRPFFYVHLIVDGEHGDAGTGKNKIPKGAGPPWYTVIATANIFARAGAASFCRNEFWINWHWDECFETAPANLCPRRPFSGSYNVSFRPPKSSRDICDGLPLNFSKLHDPGSQISSMRRPI